MDIEQSSLWNEVEEIIGGGSKQVNYTWDVTLFVDGNPITPFKVVSIDIDRDYLNNYTDFILVDMCLPLGTFAKQVYPNLDKLEIELKRVQLGENNDVIEQDTPTQVERYTATLIDEGNPILEASMGNATSEEDLNKIDIPKVRFQLLDKSLEQIRAIPIGGTYRNMTGEDVVKAVMTQASQTAKVDAVRKVKGVSMVKASNQAKRNAIILKQNLPLIEVPQYIHYHCGGLYSAGLGYFLQDDLWHIFPAFDNTRFNDGDPTLTIINVPERRLPGVERTFRNDGGNVVVLATGKVKFRDIRNTAQLNAGNGVRFTDASKMMDQFVTVKNNKAVAARAKINTEIISDKRANDVNVVTQGQKSINDNPFVEYSALTQRQGSGITLTWENSDHSLVYPGMPTKIMYLEDDTVKELYGVLLGAHEYTSLRDSGPTASRYVSIMALSVFVKPLDDSTT